MDEDDHRDLHSDVNAPYIVEPGWKNGALVARRGRGHLRRCGAAELAQQSANTVRKGQLCLDGSSGNQQPMVLSVFKVFFLGFMVLMPSFLH